MKKLLIALIISLFFCISANAVTVSPGDCLYYPLSYGKAEYVVHRGDTLGSISEKLLGSSSRWKTLWNMNPGIKDPNTIYPGQKIVVVTKNGKTDSNDPEYMAQKVFSVLRLPYISQHELEVRLRGYQFAFDLYTRGSLSPHGLSVRIEEMKDILRQLEIHDVVRTVYFITKDEEWKDFDVLLLALVWQESAFRNRDGALGEKGYCQWRVSSAKMLRPDMGREEIIHRLEFDTSFAIGLTHEHLTDLYEKYGNWKRAIARYNGGGKAASEYARCVIKKFHKIKNTRVED